MVLVAITGNAQDKIQQLKAKRVEVLSLKTSIDFVSLNPDTLAVKKQVLSIGRTNGGKTVFSMKVNKQNFIIEAFVAQMATPNGEQYFLIARGDSIQCVPQNSNEAIFTISPK